MEVTHHLDQKESVTKMLADYEDLKARAIANIKEYNPSNIGYLTDTCADVFYSKAFLGAPDAKEALRDYVDALVASLHFALHAGKKFSYTFKGETVEVTAEDKDYQVSPHTWNTAFFGATVLGDAKTLDALCAIDLEQLAATSKEEKDYTLSMAVALKAFYTKDDKYPELLRDALKDNMNVPKDNWLYSKAMDIDGPALELLYLLLLERNEQFNERLLDALKWHKRYSLMMINKGYDNGTFLISLPISAMVKLAKKLKQIPIEHTSPYIPGFLTE